MAQSSAKKKPKCEEELEDHHTSLETGAVTRLIDIKPIEIDGSVLEGVRDVQQQ